MRTASSTLRTMSREEPERKTAKLWPVTIKKLKLISTVTGDSMVKIIDRLADEELERVRADAQKLMERNAS